MEFPANLVLMIPTIAALALVAVIGVDILRMLRKRKQSRLQIN
jgi:hypothetical protein